MATEEYLLCLPSAVLRVLTTLERAGYPAYIVGGCLRDALRGKAPHDWDVTTPATPEQMLAVFGAAGVRTIETGLKHGTVTAIVDHEPVECTTYRLDGTYTDGRHPDTVSFTDRIADDLCRRDFTVNAMACRLPGVAAMTEEQICGGLRVRESELEPVDLFGGREDLGRGVLRCVGESTRRFTEDALRILRCVRFCAQLDFAVEEQTARALAECREGLRCVSVERRAVELLRMLSCENSPLRAMQLMSEAGLWEYVLPSCCPREDLLCKVSVLPPDAAMRVAQLYYNNDTFEAAQRAAGADCALLRLSRELTEDITTLVRGMYEPCPESRAAVRRLMARYGARTERVLLLRAMQDVDAEQDARMPERWARVLAEVAGVRARGECLSIASLAVNGADLAARGIRGARIGQTLRELLERVLDDPSLNQKEQLLAMLPSPDATEGRV